MSCCDNMTIAIANQTKKTATITNVSPGGSSTLQGFNVGQQISNSVTAHAFSGKGTGGDAWGSITVSLPSPDGSKVELLELTYMGNAHEKAGNCPCTASTLTGSPQSSSDYQATAVCVTGKSAGTASITWTITPVGG